MSAVLRLVGVTQQYGEGETAVSALSGVDLTVDKGELVAIMGASGSGKSTLLSIAGGLQQPTSGEIVVEDTYLSTASARQLAALRRRSLGFVFQDFDLIPTLTALENVTLPLELDGFRARVARRAGRDALSSVGLEDKVDSYPDDLSGGQQQRVAIARAVVGGRRLILADEPTGALDSVTGEAVMKMIRTRVDQGAAGILVTHEARHAAWADRIVFLRDGRIVDESRRGGADALLAGARRARSSSVRRWMPRRRRRPAPAPAGSDRGGGRVSAWRAAELGAAAAWVAVVNGPDPSLTQYDDQPLSIEIDRNPRTGEPTHEQQPLPGSAAPSLAGRDAIEIGVGSATVRTASGIAPVRAVIGDASADVLRGRFLLREGRAAAGPREAMVSPGALERLGVAIGDTVTLTGPEGSYTISGVLSRAEDTDAAVTIFLPATAQTRALQTDVQQMRWYLPTWHPARSDISRLNAAENDRASELP